MNKLRLAINSYFLKRQPISLVHFVTNKCNARCKHCFIDFNNPSLYENELSLQEIELLTKNVGNSLFNVNLTGGEPFLRRDLFDIACLYFKNTPIESVFITTNGMYTASIKEFINHFILSKIKGKIIFSISFDNFEKEHDKNRNVKGLFRNALKSYKLIQSYNNPNIIANASITVVTHNYKKVVKLYHHLAQLGINSFSATIMREEGIVKEIKMKEKILAEYIKLTNLIQENQLKGKTKGFGTHLQGTLMNSKNIIVNKIIAKMYLSKKFISQCSAGSLFGVIYANGDVYPCEILGNQKLGNLRDYQMNFMKLWEDKKARACRKFIKNTRCRCTFECAWSINVISNFKFVYPLLANAYRMKSWKNKK